MLNVFPKPEVWSFTDHFWNNCLNMADSAPSLTVSTLVLLGYPFILMKSCSPHIPHTHKSMSARVPTECWLIWYLTI